ncbi:hypothetical protein EVAR_33593_1 [Eumeta japonica]|uniref:Uncharacterized protein n=1 Tax=Eumeta variegata TaxID=151549 RepID=A0A4C1WCL4_EUMVA|nr:hypothetical protein EVAR_33593_1 [Eumeta japonica]
MKQRLLQLNLFLSEWKGRVPFTFLCLSLSLLGWLTMPEWKGRVPLTRSHCERITLNGIEIDMLQHQQVEIYDRADTTDNFPRRCIFYAKFYGDPLNGMEVVYWIASLWGKSQQSNKPSPFERTVPMKS